MQITFSHNPHSGGIDILISNVHFQAMIDKYSSSSSFEKEVFDLIKEACVKTFMETQGEEIKSVLKISGEDVKAAIGEALVKKYMDEKSQESIAAINPQAVATLAMASAAKQILNVLQINEPQKKE